MDAEAKLDRAKANVEAAIRDAEHAVAAVDAARKKTAEVLAIAEGVGVTRIGIDKTVDPGGWPFAVRGNVFTPEADRVNGWPAAWHITARAGIGYGAGNTGQHQADTSGLISGVYEVREGVWQRVDEVTA